MVVVVVDVDVTTLVVDETLVAGGRVSATTDVVTAWTLSATVLGDGVVRAGSDSPVHAAASSVTLSTAM